MDNQITVTTAHGESVTPRKAVGGIDFRIPDVVYGDFQDAPELARLARDLADEYEGDPRVNDVLWHSQGADVRYAWKRQGGKSGGRATLGKCVKLSGPAKHFAQGADYLIWVAWDHARNLQMTRDELMALLFHELCHIERDVTDDGEDVYGAKGHDLETFFAEIEVFGAWRDDLESAKSVFEQLGLMDT